MSRGSPVQTAMRNCTRDEGRSFEAGSQVLASNRCKLLSSKAMVVSVAVNVGRISRRVRLREASASEPPMNCRKRIRRCQNRGVTLVWGFRSQAEIYHLHLFLSFVPSLCSTGAIIPSSRPALRSRRRAGAVKVGRRTPTLRHAPPLPPHLDSFEPDGTLGAIGITIRGEPAFGRGSIAPQPCIRWVQGPEP